MFVNGDLKGKFIMDRNLGARDTKYVEPGTAGNIHYQYGRKDPSPCSYERTTKTTGYTQRGGEYDDLIIESGPLQIFESVKNPNVFYVSSTGNWCDGVDSEVYVWNDFETDIKNQEKSIFDPSPLGWKIMPYGTYSNFSVATMTDATPYVYEGDQAGRSYPRGENPFAYYPATGFRYAETAMLANSTLAAHAWSSTPANSKSTYALQINQTVVNPHNVYSRSGSFAVRCVQHDE